MSHSPSSSGLPSALAQQYSPALLRKDSNQGCNGSPAHLPVGSRTRTTAAASRRNLITLLHSSLLNGNRGTGEKLCLTSLRKLAVFATHICDVGAKILRKQSV